MFEEKIYGKEIYNLNIREELDETSSFFKLITDKNYQTKRMTILTLAKVFIEIDKKGLTGDFIVTDKNYLLPGHKENLEQKTASLDLDENWNGILGYHAILPLENLDLGQSPIHIHYDQNGSAKNLIKKNGKLMLD